MIRELHQSKGVIRSDVIDVLPLKFSGVSGVYGIIKFYDYTKMVFVSYFLSHLKFAVISCTNYTQTTDI